MGGTTPCSSSMTRGKNGALLVDHVPWDRGGGSRSAGWLAPGRSILPFHYFKRWSGTSFLPLTLL